MPVPKFTKIKIFKKLDAKSRLTSRLVTKSWKEIIDDSSELQNEFQMKVRKFFEIVGSKSISQLIEKFPEWHYILVQFNREKTIEEVSALAQILQNYSASNSKMELDPLMTAAKSNQMDTVNFLLLRIYLDPKSISQMIE